MENSTRTLLEHLIDYAGLFPPARLPMEEAARNFAKHRASDQSWMLARFICPASRLAELQEQLDVIAVGDDEPLAISLLGRGGDDTEAFLGGLADDLGAAQAFVDDCGDRVRIEVFETRWPASIVQSGDAAETHTLVSLTAERLAAAAGNFNPAPGETETGRAEPIGLTPFFEISLDGDWRTNVAEAAQGLADHNAGCASGSACRPAGLKLRCGGVEAATFPTVEQVAYVIEQCRDAHVPLKFTAGLHHAVRQYDPGVRTHVHGFINVFGAGVLAYVLGLERHDIVAILEEEDPRGFSFTDEFFGWNDAEATVAEVADARRRRVVSFGSCSFDEPVEDLGRLGLL